MAVKFSDFVILSKLSSMNVEKATSNEYCCEKKIGNVERYDACPEAGTALQNIQIMTRSGLGILLQRFFVKA